MPPIIHRLSYGLIIFALIALLSVPALGSVVYFGNIRDWPQTFPKNSKASSLDATKCPEPQKGYLTKKFRDGSIAGDLIAAASKSTGLEASSIAAQIEIESNFDQDATSKDTDGTNEPIAYGLMQTVAPTYNSYKRENDPAVVFTTKHKVTSRGFKYDLWIITTNPNPLLTKPEVSVFSGARYYRYLYDIYDKDAVIAAAAYNSGPGTIDNVWKKGKPLPVERLPQETRDYITRFKEKLAIYRGCQTATTPTTGGAGSTTAKTLEDWVTSHPSQACQSTGKRQCAIADRDTLQAAFPGSNGSGVTGQWIPSSSNTTGTAVDQGDLVQAQQVLDAGNLPVWHVVGDVSGQHWIVVTGINGENVRYYDPASGSIQTRSFTSASQRAGQDYFGISPQGGGDSSEGKRGYVFYPNGNSK